MTVRCEHRVRTCRDSIREPEHPHQSGGRAITSQSCDRPTGAAPGRGTRTFGESRRHHRRRPAPRRRRAQRPSFSCSSAMCFGVPTRYFTNSILPSASIAKVERMTPSTSLPYMFFSPQAP